MPSLPKVLIALLLVGFVGNVRAGERDAQSLARLIDTGIDKRLTAEGVKASPQADDAEFLRRVHLDIASAIPSSERVTSFLASKDPDKRAKLIDELLASPGYARRMTDIWKGLLIPNTAASARRKHDPMIQWLNTSFTANKPYDVFTRDVIAATGMQDQNGVVTFYITHETVDEITDRVSRVFLGVQLQCAQCHNHPFGDWTQQEYWGMAAFFTKVKSAYVKENGVERYGVKEDSNSKAKAILMVPPSRKVVPPTFLRGGEAKVEADAPYLPALAEWMTSPKNPYFARAGVNRVWQQFFSRGFVDPVDDLVANNKPSHPELLSALAQEFTDSGFDLKHLIRGICNSRAYQRASKANEGNATDKTLLSHMAVKVMSPHQLGDSLESVFSLADNDETSTPTEQTKKTKATERNRIVGVFMGDPDADPTEYQAGIPQALYLMNSNLQTKITKAANEVVSQKKTPEAVVNTFFQATLSRTPTEREAQAMLAHVAKATDSKSAYADILWALINSTEFISNH